MSEQCLVNKVLEQVEDIKKDISDLQSTFNAKIKDDVYKNKLLDELHKDLQRYRNAEEDERINAMALGVIQVIDRNKKELGTYRDKGLDTEDTLRLYKMMKELIEDLEDALYYHNIESYQVEDEKIDTTRQKIIQVIATEEEAKDNTLAERMAVGYEKNGKILRKEHIKIYKINKVRIEKG